MNCYIEKIKFIQKNHAIVASLLLVALLGWFGVIDKTLKYISIGDYQENDYKIFSELKTSLKTTKEELNEEQQKILSSENILFNDLKKEEKNNIYLNKDKVEQHYKIAKEKGNFAKKLYLYGLKKSLKKVSSHNKSYRNLKNKLQYFHTLNNKLNNVLKEIGNLEDILPENGDILKINKSELDEYIKNLKKQLSEYLQYSKQLNDRETQKSRNLSNLLSKLNIKGDYVSEKLASSRDKLMKTFMVLKVLNGTVSVIQSMEVSGGLGFVGGSVHLGETLDSFNDTVEQASEYVFLAFCSVFIQEILFAIGNKIALSLILPIGLIFGVFAYIVKKEEMRLKLLKICNSLILVALLAKFFIPTSVFVSDYMMQNFLLPQFEYAIGQVEESNKQLETYQDKSFWGKIKNTIIPKSIEKMFDKISYISFKNIFILAAIFLFDSILLPLATGYIMLKAFKFALFMK